MPPIAVDDLNLPQQGHPLASVVTAGQPSASQFSAIKAAGVSKVINLRPETEDAGFDEAAVVKGLGMEYQVIPVAGPDDLSLNSAKALDKALYEAGDAGVLIHCASSNRVGALLALRAAWLQGASDESALALGEAGGLTKMLPMVQQLLAQHKKKD
jgi:uncharacterized protein (TIGR01244 family)